MSIDKLKELVYSSDNAACFIERERVLNKLSAEMKEYDAPDRYVLILSRLLAKVSTPVDENDVFAGRVLEALPDPDMSAPSLLLCSTGHMSFQYEKLLRIGLRGILEETKEAAARRGDVKSLEFAANAEIVVAAIRDYARRYATAARQCGNNRAADALEVVPYEGAYNLFSALQSVWLVHMIASCYIGGRDYAFGRFDRTMYPYYQSAVSEGMPHDEIVELLRFFFIKTNEICGRTAHNYSSKPVPCQSSKQYVNIGGACPNLLSAAVLEAAEKNGMAQPQITVLLKPDADPAFTERVFRSMSVLRDRMHIYNYDLICRCLINKGVERETAADFTFSACCTLDLHHRTIRQEYYVPAVQIFCETLYGSSYGSTGELLKEYGRRVAACLREHVQKAVQEWPPEYNRRAFVLDSLLIGDCAERCRYPMEGGMKHHMLNLFFPGIATLGDSLSALDRIVFKQRRFSYCDFIGILQNDFAGHEKLRAELESMTKFGNDSDADQGAAEVAGTLLDAVDGLRLPEGWTAVGGFYSLERDNTSVSELPATPDGRHAGVPYSENQSPVYGGDRSGITALLRSLAKLPFARTATGGLNLTFSHEVPPEILRPLLLTYFGMGGLHAGITVLNRETLRDAMDHPEKYKSLTVRLYGFSEYFISLPQWQQLAVLRRTEY